MFDDSCGYFVKPLTKSEPASLCGGFCALSLDECMLCIVQCMGEIANLKFDDHPKVGEYTQKFQQAFVSLMERCTALF